MHFIRNGILKTAQTFSYFHFFCSTKSFNNKFSRVVVKILWLFSRKYYQVDWKPAMINEYFSWMISMLMLISYFGVKLFFPVTDNIIPAEYLLTGKFSFWSIKTAVRSNASQMLHKSSLKVLFIFISKSCNEANWSHCRKYLNNFINIKNKFL